MTAASRSGQAEHLEAHRAASRTGSITSSCTGSEHGLELLIAVAVADAPPDELVRVDAERERLLLRADAAREGNLAALPAEDLEQALLRLIVDGAKELDGPEHADPDERIADPAAEAREHRQRHLELHAQHLPALDEKLAEELALLGRRHALGRALDEEDPLSPRAVAQNERAGLAAHREVEDARREPRRVEVPAVDRVGGKVGVPLERGARRRSARARGTRWAA